ncbi:MAG TPA: hypothetical protein PLD47_05725 [Aggregatilineales bacterium]|nr:hypothetical protein [Anaerolineales bacterium]HRE47206.1 hypothetical protein [Aggregatilineales bacterium]
MENIDKQELRRQVEVSIRRQKALTRWILFGVNALMFVGFSIFAWIVLIRAGHSPLNGMNFPGNETDWVSAAAIMLNVGWGVGLLFQFIMIILETNWGQRQMRDRAMGAIMARMLLGEDESGAEKRKRAMRLTHDGELEEIEGEPSSEGKVIKQGEK